MGEPVSVTRHERGHRSLWSEGGAVSQGMRELSRRQERQAAGSPPLETLEGRSTADMSTTASGDPCGPLTPRSVG